MSNSDKNKHHVSSYAQHAAVLLVLLVLTFVTVFVTKFHFGAFSVGVALLIAAFKASTVLTYFMHLKFESLFMRLMVAGVFIIFALVIIITFIDYLFR